MKNKKFLITGGTGFIGSRLIPKLLASENEVTLLSRNTVRAAQKFNQAINVISHMDELKDNVEFDIVINLVGQGIADKRWTDKIKQQLRESRLKLTQSLMSFLKRVEKSLSA